MAPAGTEAPSTTVADVSAWTDLGVRDAALNIIQPLDAWTEEVRELGKQFEAGWSFAMKVAGDWRATLLALGWDTPKVPKEIRKARERVAKQQARLARLEYRNQQRARIGLGTGGTNV